jgi:transposase InsO family protein
VSVARFIADQRTLVPGARGVHLPDPRGQRLVVLQVDRPRPTRRQRRRAKLDAAVAAAFKASRGLHGSPRLHADLRAKGWTVSEKTVADSMRRQGLVARIIKRRNGLTKQDKNAPFPDLVKRDFTATAMNEKWVGDITEIPTAAGKLYLATVIDLYSRRLLAAATSLHPDAELAGAAIKMAAAVRGGREHIKGVIFHTDRGSTGGFNWSSQHLDHGGVGWRRPRMQLPQAPTGARRQWAADRAMRPPMRSPGRPEPSRAVQREFWRLIATGVTTVEASAGGGRVVAGRVTAGFATLAG